MSALNNSISFFQMSVEEKKRFLEKQPVIKIESQLNSDCDWQNIEDCCNSLERLRAFQLSEIFGKYKLF